MEIVSSICTVEPPLSEFPVFEHLIIDLSIKRKHRPAIMIAVRACIIHYESNADTAERFQSMNSADSEFETKQMRNKSREMIFMYSIFTFSHVFRQRRILQPSVKLKHDPREKKN